MSTTWKAWGSERRYWPLSILSAPCTRSCTCPNPQQVIAETFHASHVLYNAHFFLHISRNISAPVPGFLAEIFHETHIMFLHISRNIFSLSQAQHVILETFREIHICSYPYLGIFQHLSQAKDVLCGNPPWNTHMFLHILNIGIFLHLSKAWQAIAANLPETHICSYIYLGIFQHLSQAKDVLCGNLP